MADEEIRELLTSLARTQVDISLLLAEIPAASITVKPALIEFSVLENICHLRDIEIEGYGVRIQRILTEENPFLSDIDGSRLAIERDYNKQSLSDALASFGSARQQNLNVLNNSAVDFLRTGELEGVGSVTLRKLLEMMFEHDQGHMEELRRVGRLTSDQS
jgi:hypothetical protein